MTICMISWEGREFPFFSPAQMPRDWHLSIWPIPSLLPRMKELIFIKSGCAQMKCSNPSCPSLQQTEIYYVEPNGHVLRQEYYINYLQGIPSGVLSCLWGPSPLLSPLPGQLGLLLSLCSEAGGGKERLGFCCSGNLQHPDLPRGPVSLKAQSKFLLQQDGLLCLLLHLFYSSHSPLLVCIIWHIELMLWKLIHISTKEVFCLFGAGSASWWDLMMQIWGDSRDIWPEHNEPHQNEAEPLGKAVEKWEGRSRDCSFSSVHEDMSGTDWEVICIHQNSFIGKWQNLIQKSLGKKKRGFIDPDYWEVPEEKEACRHMTGSRHLENIARNQSLSLGSALF